MALRADEPLLLCRACSGRAYYCRMDEYAFPHDVTTGRCDACLGSGLANATAREAFEREHGIAVERVRTDVEQQVLPSSASGD